jgi:Na+/H+-dicarboxylate symporter
LLTSTLATIGSSFVSLLKALVPPLIVTAVIERRGAGRRLGPR